MRVKRLQDLVCDIWTAAHQKKYKKIKSLAHQIYDLLEEEKEIEQ